MKQLYLIIFTMFFGISVHAEPWVDWSVGEEVTELTIMDVQSNYTDTYLTNLKTTLIRDLQIRKDLGLILDYAVWVSHWLDHPNVYITTFYANAEAAAPNQANDELVAQEWENRYSDENEEAIQQLGFNYEEIRTVVDHTYLRRVTFHDVE